MHLGFSARRKFDARSALAAAAVCDRACRRRRKQSFPESAAPINKAEQAGAQEQRVRGTGRARVWEHVSRRSRVGVRALVTEFSRILRQVSTAVLLFPSRRRVCQTHATVKWTGTMSGVRGSRRDPLDNTRAARTF